MVECIFVWEGETKGKLDVQSPPNSFTGIVFNYGDPYSGYQDPANVVVAPQCFFAGLSTTNYHLILEGKIGQIGVVLPPHHAHNLLGMRMSESVNTRIPLSYLVGDEATEVMTKLRECTEDQQRVDIVDAWLSRRVEAARQRFSIVDEAIEYMSQNKGSVSVEQVAANFRISRRYLEKQFIIKVGVSPKLYARIIRFGLMSNRVAHQKEVDWQDIVYEGGYHDQSHLAKEYKKFNKMKPGDYHENHSELVRQLDPTREKDKDK